MGPAAEKIGAGLLFAAVAVGVIALGALPLTVFIGILAMVAVAELFALLRARGMRPIPFVGFLAVAGILAVAYVRAEEAPPAFPVVVAASLALGFVVLIAQARVDGAATALMSSLLGVAYIGVLSGYLVVIVRMGIGLALGFALMTLLNDVGAYAVGSWRGRHAMAPTVSPSKTWEGFVGGAVVTGATALVVAAAISPPFDRPRALIAAAVIVIAAPLGDLCESMLKRDLGVKDTGTLLPGHGGMLDRLDSLLIAAPLFFYVWRALVR